MQNKSKLDDASQRQMYYDLKCKLKNAKIIVNSTANFLGKALFDDEDRNVVMQAFNLHEKAREDCNNLTKLMRTVKKRITQECVVRTDDGVMNFVVTECPTCNTAGSMPNKYTEVAHCYCCGQKVRWRR